MDQRDEALGDMVPDSEVDKAYDDCKDRHGEALDDKACDDCKDRRGEALDDKAYDDCKDRRGVALGDEAKDNEVRDGTAYDDMVGDGMVRSLDGKVHVATHLDEDRDEVARVAMHHYGLSLVWETPKLLPVTLHHEPLQKIPGHQEQLLIHQK